MVGAGPAGSICAREAACAGLKVLVLERRKEVGVPIQCGGGLQHTTLDMFGIKPDDELVVNPVHGIRTIYPGGGIYTRCTNKGYIVRRNVLDSRLAREARDKGVVFVRFSSR